MEIRHEVVNLIYQVQDMDQESYLVTTVMSLQALKGELSGVVSHLLASQEKQLHRLN
jgi:hypothetical protein